MTAYPDWPVERVKQALFKGGIARANKPEGVRNTPGIQARHLNGQHPALHVRLQNHSSMFFLCLLARAGAAAARQHGLEQKMASAAP